MARDVYYRMARASVAHTGMRLSRHDVQELTGIAGGLGTIVDNIATGYADWKQDPYVARMRGE
jgi:hypothetical protein